MPTLPTHAFEAANVATKETEDLLTETQTHTKFVMLIHFRLLLRSLELTKKLGVNSTV